MTIGGSQRNIYYIEEKKKEWSWTPLSVIIECELVNSKCGIKMNPAKVRASMEHTPPCTTNKVLVLVG